MLTFIPEARRLAERLAVHDLAGRRVLVVPSSDIGLTLDPSTFAMAGVALDLTFHSQLSLLDPDERVALIVLNPASLDGLPRDSMREIVLGVVVHEMAHWVQRSRCYVASQPARAMKAGLFRDEDDCQFVAAAIETNSEPNPARDAAKLVRDHCAAWSEITAALLVRAGEFGYLIDPSITFSGSLVRDPWPYIRLAQDAADSRRHRAFSDVIRSPSPDVIALWEADRLAYLQATSTESGTDAAPLGTADGEL